MFAKLKVPLMIAAGAMAATIPSIASAQYYGYRDGYQGSRYDDWAARREWRDRQRWEARRRWEAEQQARRWREHERWEHYRRYRDYDGDRW